MASTFYTDFQPPAVNSAWLNDANRVVYEVLGNPTTISELVATLESAGIGGGTTVDSVDLAVSGQDLTITIGRGSESDLTDTVTIPGGSPGDSGGIPGGVGITGLNVLTQVSGTATIAQTSALTGWTTAGGVDAPRVYRGVAHGASGAAFGITTAGALYNYSPATGTDSLTSPQPSVLGGAQAMARGSAGPLIVFGGLSRFIYEIDVGSFVAEILRDENNSLIRVPTEINNNVLWYGNGFFWSRSATSPTTVVQLSSQFALTGVTFDVSGSVDPSVGNGAIQTAVWDGRNSTWWAFQSGGLVPYTEDWIQAGGITTETALSGGNTTSAIDGNGVFITGEQGLLQEVINNRTSFQLPNVGLLVEAGSEMLVHEQGSPDFTDFVNITEVFGDDMVLSDTAQTFTSPLAVDFFRRNSLGDVIQVVKTSEPFTSAWRTLG